MLGRAVMLAVGLTLGGCTLAADDEAVVGFDFTADELDTHERIDAYRAGLGLPALEADPVLGELARIHSEDMLAERVAFGHDGFDQRSQDIFDSGARGAAENVAFNMFFDDPVGTAVEGWIDSPGHLENIVGDWTHGGVGLATDGDSYYFTHLFALR